MIKTDIYNENQDEKRLFESVRSVAVRILSRFERSDAYIEKLIDAELKNGELNSLDKSLLMELVTGTIRWRGKLDFVLNGFYNGDYMKCLNVVKNSMRVALYQIMFLDKIPVHAAINEAVELVKRIQGDRTAGIVNGVLRNIHRNLENIRFPEKDDDPAYFYSVLYSHPRWMVRRWLERFTLPDVEKILIANNEKPSVVLRVNTLKTSALEIAAILKERNISFKQSIYLPESFVIDSKIKVQSLDLFQQGFVTVQDVSASLAAKLANPKPGDRVVDLCSAPGGKSFYLAELSNDKAQIIAIDKYPSKLDMIKNGSERLGLNSLETSLGDAREFQDEEKFDIVFADVPCSGLGTLSKKPDIKWKREREDIYKLAELQRQILENAATLVKDSGALIYSTCTIEPEENTEQVEWFLKKFPEFQIDPAEKYLPKECVKDSIMQTFQHIQGIDGAFAVRFIKK